MPIHTICQFNPFNLQHGSDHMLHVKIQEVIYYGEFWLWSIVNEISQANVDQQVWTQKLLHRELLFILSYLGIASAIGQAVDVPIILRSLAHSMAMLHEDDLPIAFDPDFLLTLDIGAHENDNESRVVSNYERSWWKGRKPRDLVVVEILDESCLDRCLMVHKIQLAFTHPGVVVDSPVSSRPVMPASSGSAGTPNTGAGTDPDPDAGSHPLTAAEQCHQYWDLLSSVLQDFLHTHRTTSGRIRQYPDMSNSTQRHPDVYEDPPDAYNVTHTRADMYDDTRTPTCAAHTNNIRITNKQQQHVQHTAAAAGGSLPSQWQPIPGATIPPTALPVTTFTHHHTLCLLL
ncbi:hypothetical protein BYT27DRAFT_7249119 [Phlegmacium glaucopus]|nr:hypothetical protein BYT27DRAFT_7249119 [Phlegmacium glaucopus]